MRRHLRLALSIGLLATLGVAPGLSPALAAVQGPAARNSGQQILPRRGLDGAPLPRGGTLEEVLGGRSSSLSGPLVAVTRTLAPGVYQITFDDPGTGWQESVLLGVPSAPLLPAPLLVAFHGYGNSEADILVNTSFFEDAMARGWFVLAPLGAHKFNFGVPYAQQNVSYVLDWLLGVATIDRFRIYGVGFSMGGGWALSYAARHLDPTRAMFAAVVNHTGTVSVSHVWWHSNDTSVLEHTEMFGGPPSQYPFNYQRVSTIDLNHQTLVVDPASDMGRNLRHIPTTTWMATQDPLAYLVTQSNAFFGWLSQYGFTTQLVEIASNVHSWSTLDETAVLDDLEQHVLSVPVTGTNRLMADRDGRYLFFDVEQDAPGALTPWRYHIDPGQNRLIVDQSQNLRRLTCRTASMGLDTSQPLTVVIGIQDGLNEQITLKGYAQPPSSVLRNSVPTSSWIHDPVARTLTLFESNGAYYPAWLILP